GVAEQRWLRGFGNRQGAAHRVDHCRRGFGEGPQGDQPERQKRAGDPSGESGLLPHTLTILTAHFLKSVWNDIGSVASSVTLLISWLASNHGTNTNPRGGLLRPRVSTRVRMLPRRDAISTSTPRRTPSAMASSGCM